MGIKYFFDTYALFSLVEAHPKYINYLDSPVVITQFNLVELYWSVLRDHGEKKAKEIYYKFEPCVSNPSPEVIFDAMKFKIKQKKKRLSYADCIGYSFAKHNDLKFLTGDRQFEHFNNVEFVR